MNKWEYKVEALKGWSDRELQEFLWDMGEDEWELIVFDSEYQRLIFKRPKEGTIERC